MKPSVLLANQVVHCLKEAGLYIKHQCDWEAARTLEPRVDSRKVKEEALFIAYNGVSFDSHQKISELVGQVYGFIIEDEKYIKDCHGAPWVLVKSSRKAWAWLASARHGKPERSLTICGITGTNGKTSTVWIYGEVLKALNYPVLTIGTLGAFCDDKKLPTTHTTPDPEELYHILSLAVESGVKHVAMEVSSHAIDQGKVDPIRFSGAAFTSFSRDHLDYHGTMEDYLEIKCRLFSRLLKNNGFQLIHKSVADQMKKLLPTFDSSAASIYASGKANDIGYQTSETSSNGSLLKFDSYQGMIPFIDGHSVDNFVAALVMARELTGGLLDPKMWKLIPSVPGRLELIKGGHHQPTVFVDYAHTPDALERTLLQLKNLSTGKLWVVFGCGGDRDRGKRSLMGKVATNHADSILVTSDNPRTEDPMVIIADILVGCPSARTQEDRMLAIREAIGAACSDDIVLIAGKGHEDYQILGQTKISFDDRKVVRDFLNRA
ncbi:MAG: UDP-N-acetylmuramoyl-L-alanyl-D-glutamate--2,6-diaminopimelate ligase [Zetaproteobacteria bacterium]|nr:UDP-N-acetylmuramoyl-L-alanyl-D-glutamate--2,6-diaminopimelate ligase [Pseudobdellovibrionaceae bacterium]